MFNDFLKPWTHQNKEKKVNPGPWLPTPSAWGLWEEKKNHRFSQCPTEKDNMLPSQKLTYAIQRGSWEDGIVPRIEVSEFLVPQVWLVNGAPSSWVLETFPENESRHVFDVHTTHCKILTEPGKPVKNKTYPYLSCFVLTDWRKSRLGDPKHEQIPTKNHLYKYVDHLQGIISPHVGDGAHHCR